MKYLIALVICLGLGVVSFFPHPGSVVSAISDKLPTVLSVIMAAILVRLARGLPTIPFEKINSAQALSATSAFRMLLKAYVQSLTVVTVAIILNLLCNGFIIASAYPVMTRAYIAVLGFVDALVVVVVFFLVSADIKISKIQADLMDQVTGASATTSAHSSIDTVRGAFANKDRPTPAVSKPTG